MASSIGGIALNLQLRCKRDLGCPMGEEPCPLWGTANCSNITKEDWLELLNADKDFCARMDTIVEFDKYLKPDVIVARTITKHCKDGTCTLGIKHCVICTDPDNPPCTKTTDMGWLKEIRKDKRFLKHLNKKVREELDGLGINLEVL